MQRTDQSCCILHEERLHDTAGVYTPQAETFPLQGLPEIFAAYKIYDGRWPAFI
jgi:hypothetical protein